MPQYAEPFPEIRGVEAIFWAEAAKGRLVVQRCRACRAWVHYPRISCPHCAAADPEWVTMSGRGRVYSFTVIQRAGTPAFRGEEPYTLAIVELDEGPRLMTNIVDCPPEQVKIDMPVTVAYRPVNDEIAVPVFRPA
jgi:uncharacterized OB-fold protein